MDLKKKTDEEVGSYLQQEFPSFGVNFSSLCEQQMIDGVALSFMTSSADWKGAWLKSGPAATVANFVRMLSKSSGEPARKRVASEASVEREVATTSLRKRSLLEDDSGATNKLKLLKVPVSKQKPPRSVSSSMELTERAVKIVSARDIRAAVKEAFYNFCVVSFKGKEATRFIAKSSEIINRLYGPACSVKERAEVERLIGLKLTSQRRSVKKKIDDLKLKGELELQYDFGRSAVVLLAYGSKLRESDIDFFTRLHQARVTKPQVYYETKVASGLVLERIGSDHNSCSLLRVKVATKEDLDHDLRVPFPNLLPSQQIRWASQLHTEAINYWPECCTRFCDEDEIEELDNSDCEELALKPDAQPRQSEVASVKSSTNKTVETEELEIDKHMETNRDEESSLQPEPVSISAVNEFAHQDSHQNPQLEMESQSLAESHAMTQLPPCTSAFPSVSEEELEEKLRDLDVEKLKQVASILLQQPKADLSLVTVRSFAASYNRSSKTKFFSISASMNYVKALQHIIQRAVKGGLLKIKSEAWETYVFNSTTVICKD